MNPETNPPPAPSEKAGHNKFPIVGVGASAGGLESFTQLLESLPAKTGMAFVLVQHLDPNYKSILSELLARKTIIPLKEAQNGMRVEPDHVYLIPPNTDMTIGDGHLVLRPRTQQQGRHMSIDSFLHSLAEVQRSASIGVVLSGNATDGTLGLKAIKAEGGITFVQEPDTAKFAGMPRSAIAAGCADYVLPVDKIAKELALLGEHPYLQSGDDDEEKTEPSSPREVQGDGTRVFALLRKSSGVDFSSYKQSTIRRRISRRMLLHKIPTMDAYAKFLSENPGELDALYQDILIKVTRFFRDPDVFEFLGDTIFPQIVDNNRSLDVPIRIWVPGCATGEEVYSLAICLLETMGNTSANMPIQFFATDISEQAINAAREGIFLENISLDVSPERLRRFFVKVDAGWQVSKTIRDVCIFARQNLASDPPFSKLDLISCRNVLIYLESSLQKRVMPLFHYALKPNGFIMLGSSETVGSSSELFLQVDRKHKIYSKRAGSGRMHVDFSMHTRSIESGGNAPAMQDHSKEENWSAADAKRDADRIVLSRYSAAGVVVDGDLEIVQFRGDTGTFLNHSPGEPSLNLMKMAGESLALELRPLINEVKAQKAPKRLANVTHHSQGKNKRINIEVTPLGAFSEKANYFLILFEEVNGEKHPDGAVKVAEVEPVPKGATERQVAQLQQELAATRHHLQSIIEEQEATNEELQSANEEILSSNEELQSINEELETAKEELQSTNEELTTVNDELHNRNSELSQLNNDLGNLLASVNIPILMLGSDLRIRRFTPQAERLLCLIPGDVGRPLGDIKPRLETPDLEQLVIDVIDSVTVKEIEVRDRDGRWYSMRIRPYKTRENKIDGAVIAMLDIDALKKNIADLTQAGSFADAIVETVREPLLILSSDLKVKRANQAFMKSFGLSQNQIADQYIYRLGNDEWNIPELRDLLENIIPRDTKFEGFKVNADFKTVGPKKMVLNARTLVFDNNELILLAIEDATLYGE